MLPAERLHHTARCTNVSACLRATAGEAVEWYLGPGEYCPECGEALVTDDAVFPSAHSLPPAVAAPPVAIAASSSAAWAAVHSTSELRTSHTVVDRLTVPPTARETGFVLPFRWFL